MDAITLLGRNMERFWEDFSDLYGESVVVPEMMTDYWFIPTSETCYPTVDILRTKEHYNLYVELPGLNEKDFNVEVNNGMLTISGKHVLPENKEALLIHSERPTGEFCRSFELPEDVDGEHIEANYKNGLLEIKLPRKVTPEKHIKVEVH
jgi:HSP20 family molecular chaperone IbpA